MTLTQIIYEILDAASLSVPEIVAGTAAGNTAVADGLLTFFPLPSVGANFADGNKNTIYQFDIWHRDMYVAEEYKDEVVAALLGRAGIYGDKRAIIFVPDTDQGATVEDDGNLYHYVVTFNVKSNK